MISATIKQLILNPTPLPNEVVEDQPREDLAHYADAPAGVLQQRLRELDREWDVERLTGITSGLVLLGSLLLVALLGAGWLVLPAVLGVGRLVHGLSGWTPALPLLRGLGFRTPREIACESCALRAILQSRTLVKTPQDREDLSRFENEGGPAAESPIHSGPPAAQI